MRTTISRLKASTGRFRKASIALLAPFLFISTGHAAPGGVVGTIFNGPKPTDAMEFCLETQTCSLPAGVMEVWYGVNNSWIYKLMSGSVPCSNSNFTDPASGSFKKCYWREATMPEVLPPFLNELPLVFETNDLLTANNQRYVFSVLDGGARKIVTSPRFVVNLKPLPLGPRLPQNYFQFDIDDRASPLRQYSVFISPTLTRCVNFHVSPSGIAGTVGRIMEIYSMTSIPDLKVIPQRTDMQKICTNDKGQLTFNLKPPSIDAFQIKVLNFTAAGNPNDVFDLFIPTNLEWRNRQ